MKASDFDQNLKAAKFIAGENGDTVNKYKENLDSFYLSFTPLAVLMSELKTRLAKQHCYLVSGSQDFKVAIAALHLNAFQEGEDALFLVRSFSHAIAVYFLKHQGILKCFLNDPCLSASSLTPNLVYHMLGQLDVQVILSGVKQQYSWNTCSTFALLTLEYCAKQGKAIFEQLQNAKLKPLLSGRVHCVHDMADLPISLVKLVESIKQIKSYIRKTGKGHVEVDDETGQTLFQYVCRKKIPRPVGQTGGVNPYGVMAIGALSLAIGIAPPISGLLGHWQSVLVISLLWGAAFIFLVVAAFALYKGLCSRGEDVINAWFEDVAQNTNAAIIMGQHFALFQAVLQRETARQLRDRILSVYPLHLGPPEPFKLAHIEVAMDPENKCVRLLIKASKKYDNLFYHSVVHCRFCGKTPRFSPLKIKGLRFSADKLPKLLDDPLDAKDHSLNISYQADTIESLLTSLMRFKRSLDTRVPKAEEQLYALRQFSEQAIAVVQSSKG